jgi:hypothetical protein
VARGEGRRADKRHDAAAPRKGGSEGAPVDLIAVLVAVTTMAHGAVEPRVLSIRGGTFLPSGPFGLRHRSLQAGLRGWVESQTHHPLGYVEQLYTFADADRRGDRAGPMVSISYLALTREGPPAGADEPEWRGWYEYFPWEDRRGGVRLVDGVIAPRLATWAAAEDEPARRRRAALVFGLDGQPWHEELVLQRYELLWEAGMVPESRHGSSGGDLAGLAIPGLAMRGDHRRILATGIARLRAKIKYRPVVFELLPPSFTLLELQRCVEAIAGRAVHKQNFRRLIEQQELVEETGAVARETGGRPAKLFRFRRAVLEERAVAGTKVGVTRG